MSIEHGAALIMTRSSNHPRCIAHPSIPLFMPVNSSLAGGSSRRYNHAMLRRSACLLLLMLSISIPALPGNPVTLDVQVQAAGGVRAKATVVFPVEPAIIHSLLTDYAHWPDLFEVRMRVAELREQDGTAFTDIRIDHSLLPGERRLLCESRALPGGGLLTELKGGDFKQYRRVWKLSSVEGGKGTTADFDLLVEIDSIVPDWMIAIAMRQELESHFRIVREKGLLKARGER